MPVGNSYPSEHLVLSPFWRLAYAPVIETSFPEFVSRFFTLSESEIGYLTSHATIFQFFKVHVQAPTRANFYSYSEKPPNIFRNNRKKISPFV